MIAILLAVCLFVPCWGSGNTLAAEKGKKADVSKEAALGYPPIQLEDVPSLQPRLPVFFSDESRLKAIPYESEKQALSGIPAFREPAGEARVVEGYRVQVYAGKDQAAARKTELQIRERYGVTTYLVYEAPQYKVRVGDFIDRNQAVSFCKTLKDGGYMDAWVVRSLVPVGR